MDKQNVVFLKKNIGMEYYAPLEKNAVLTQATYNVDEPQRHYAK